MHDDDHRRGSTAGVVKLTVLLRIAARKMRSNGSVRRTAPAPFRPARGAAGTVQAASRASAAQHRPSGQDHERS